MSKLLTLILVGAGAAYMWRRRQVQRCHACQQTVRAEAQTCRFCGVTLGPGPVIDVRAETERPGS